MIFFLGLIASASIAWQDSLKKSVERIDEGFAGHIGTVVKNINDGSVLNYHGDQKWYLSSTVKIFVAISLLEDVEKGKISLDEKYQLKTSDYIDGGGKLKWSPAGTEFSIRDLFQAMLRESDSTATDILIRRIGLEELNRDVKRWIPDAGPMTTLADVRLRMYSELHPKAKNLTNMDFVELRNTPLEKRHEALARKLGIAAKDLQAKSIEEAFEKFYQKGYNEISLTGFVQVLEKLAKGEMLTPEHTKLMLETMESMQTGDERLKAGFPENLRFAQKTGTQIRRACNVGLVRRVNENKYVLAVAACIDKPSDSLDSDSVFRQIGESLNSVISKE